MKYTLLFGILAHIVPALLHAAPSPPPAPRPARRMPPISCYGTQASSPFDNADAHPLRDSHNTQAYAADAQRAAEIATAAASRAHDSQTTAAQVLAEAQEALRQANLAAKQAKGNAILIQSITPAIICIGAYCLYSSLIIASDMQRHYLYARKYVLRKLQKARERSLKKRVFER